MAGISIGSVIAVRIRNGPAPHVLAASSREVSARADELRQKRTVIGMDETPEMIAMPDKE